MSNPYLIEQLVKSKMDEVEREVQHARLLEETGFAKTNWFAHPVDALLNLFIRKAKDFQHGHLVKALTYEPCCDDAAD